MEGKKHKGCVREYYSTFEADIVQVPLFFFFFFSPRQFWIHESKSSKLERAAIQAGTRGFLISFSISLFILFLGILPPNAPFTSCMPPHPLFPGVAPFAPPGFQYKIPPPPVKEKSEIYK